MVEFAGLNIPSSPFMTDVGTQIASNIKWIFPVIALVIIGAIFLFFIRLNALKKSWTHKLKIRKKYADGSVSKDISIIPMKRHVDKDGKITKTFKLQRPFMGCNLFIDPQHYTGENEVSIIVDENNRIWYAEKETWNPSSDSINISTRCAEIDIQQDKLRETVKLANALTKHSNLEAIIQSAIKALVVIAFIIVAGMVIQEWGKVHQADMQREQVGLERDKLNLEAQELMQQTTNAQSLQLVYLLEQLYPNRNIQAELNRINQTMQENADEL